MCFQKTIHAHALPDEALVQTHPPKTLLVKLAENLVYGAPEWTRSPRLPLIGQERDRVVATIRDPVVGLASLAEKSA
jgi:4-hydroxy-tetrahydrodipicolinate synthase